MSASTLARRAIATSALVVGAAGIVPSTASAFDTEAVPAVGDVHHPDCEGLVKDLALGEPTPVAGEVWVNAGNQHYNDGYHDAGYVVPSPYNGHAVSHVDVCPAAPPLRLSMTRPRPLRRPPRRRARCRRPARHPV